MIDVLINRIDELNNPTVVGLDPTIEMIPGYLKEAKFAEFGKTPQAVAEMFVEFNRQIMLAVQGIVPAVKPQVPKNQMPRQSSIIPRKINARLTGALLLMISQIRIMNTPAMMWNRLTKASSVSLRIICSIMRSVSPAKNSGSSLKLF